MMPAHTLNRAFQRAEAHVARGGIDCRDSEPCLAAASRFERVNGRNADFRELRFQLVRNVWQGL